MDRKNAIQTKFIGEQIKLKRNQLKFRLTDMEELAGITMKTIRAIEAGSENVKLGNWLNVMDVLGLKFELKQKTIADETR